MYDYKAEKLARIAVILYAVSLLIFIILFLKYDSEGYVLISEIFLIIAIPAYLAGLVLAVIAKIKCKYSSFVDEIFRIYLYTTGIMIAIVIAALVFLQMCIHLINGID